MVPLKDNITLARILALAHLSSIIRIARVPCGSLCQFEHFSAPRLKVTITECRARERFNPHELPQVIRSTSNDTQSIKNE